MKKLKKLLILSLLFTLIIGCSNNKLDASNVSNVYGKTINVNNLQMDIHSAKIQKEVKPNKPQGYYPHYKEKEGYHYYVLRGTLRNMGDSIFNLKNLKINCTKGNDTFQAKLVLINEVESYFWDEIGPSGSLDFYLFSIIKDGDCNPESFNFYYDSDNQLEDEQVKFDYKVTYKIPEEFINLVS